MEEEKKELAPAVSENQISTIAEKVTPVSMMENALSTFMADIFEEVRQENLYAATLREHVLSRLDDMKPSEVIALITAESTNKNDLVSKVISPTMQLLTVAQQNELAERKEKAKEEEKKVVSTSNIGQVSELAPSEVLVGLQTLFNMTSMMQPNNNNNNKIVPTRKDENDETPFVG